MKSCIKSISFCDWDDVCFSPSAEVLRPMLCRECKKTDYFVVSRAQVLGAGIWRPPRRSDQRAAHSTERNNKRKQKQKKQVC